MQIHNLSLNLNRNELYWLNIFFLESEIIVKHTYLINIIS